MGNKGGKFELKKKEVSRFVATTPFNADEVRALHLQFQTIRSDDTDEQRISLLDFHRALGFRGSSSRFVERVFTLFDEDKDGLVTFNEFIHGVALLSSNGTYADKLRFSFDLYNASGDGLITKEELRVMLASTLEENDVVLSAVQVQTLVDATFALADLNGDGKIDFEEYKAMVATNPNILKPLTLDVSELIREARSRVADGVASSGGATGAAPAGK